MKRFLPTIQRYLVMLVTASFVAGACFYIEPIFKTLHWRAIGFNARHVARISNQKGSGGTGFLLTDGNKTVIMTNAHICRLAGIDGTLQVELGSDVFLLRPIKEFAGSDLCAIQAPEGYRSGLKLAQYWVQGQRIYVAGHPLLEPRSITEGEISSKITITSLVKYNPGIGECEGQGFHEEPILDLQAAMQGIRSVCLRDVRALSTTANVQPGNSGSPVLNMFGNVTGVIFAANNNRSYAVPLEDIREFLKEL